MSPIARVLRTALQIVIALAVAIPGAVKMLEVDATTTAKVAAYAGACVLLASAAMNAIERASGKTLGAVRAPAPAPPPGPPPIDPLA